MTMTWLPYDNPTEIAEVLLPDERKEACIAAASIITGINAYDFLIRLWEGEHGNLARYGLVVGQDFNLSCKSVLRGAVRGDWITPDWLSPALCESHRAMLKHLGQCKALKQRLGPRFNEWRLDFGIPPLHDCTPADIERATFALDAEGVQDVPVQYSEFDEAPDPELVWPDHVRHEN